MGCRKLYRESPLQHIACFPLIHNDTVVLTKMALHNHAGDATADSSSIRNSIGPGLGSPRGSYVENLRLKRVGVDLTGSEQSGFAAI